MNEKLRDSDYEWFLDNYLDLFREYGASYLVIKNKTVLGAYKSYAEGVKSVRDRVTLGTFIVQECNGDESAYTNYISSVNF